MDYCQSNFLLKRSLHSTGLADVESQIQGQKYVAGAKLLQTEKLFHVKVGYMRKNKAGAKILQAH